VFSTFRKILNHLKIKDMIYERQSKAELLEYQTSLLNSFFLPCFAYILERRDLDWGLGPNCLTGGGGTIGAGRRPPSYAVKKGSLISYGKGLDSGSIEININGTILAPEPFLLGHSLIGSGLDD
jgi:hypothetical protein